MQRKQLTLSTTYGIVLTRRRAAWLDKGQR